MAFASAASQHPLPTHAIGEVVGQILESIGEAPDAAVLFVSAALAGATEDLAATVRATLRPGALIGATTAAVIADGRELEDTPSVALFALRTGPRRRMSSGSCRAVRLDAQRHADGWEVTSDASLTDARATLILLADPFSFPVEAFVADLTGQTPGLTLVGGLASAAAGAGGNRLVVDDRVVDSGAVALVLPPGVATSAVVSQGCRPVGVPQIVTRSRGTMIEEIAGRPALDLLLALADEVDPDDRRRMASGLHVGVVTDEAKLDFHRGDFVIGPVIGADHERRSVAIGVEVEVGSTVQFHVRDADTADEDLVHLLAGVDGEAALVFTGSGRGRAFFGAPDHDAGLVAERVDGGPTAGMFCAGEVGPVGGRHGVHAMTTTVLLLDGGRNVA